MKVFLKEFPELLKWICKITINKKNKPYDNHKEKIVILGNGPSLSDFPILDYKSNDYSFCCVNFFPVKEELFFKIKPKYYCAVDPAFFGSLNQTIEYKELMGVLERIDWDMTLITTNGNRFPIENPHIQYNFINENRLLIKISKWSNWLYKNNLATCDYQNVIVAALYYFIMSSAKKIVLTGVENNWHRELYVNRENDVLREDTHFYGMNTINLTQKGEIKKGELYKYFFFYYATLYQYKIMADFAAYNNINVINSCMDSYIDVFTKQEARSIIYDK